MKLKHDFKVNQVWVSEKRPEKSLFIYQLHSPDVNEYHDANEESFYAAVLINKKLFHKIVDEYQETHNVKDRSSTYPFCIFKEGQINSLKNFIKKWECKLLCEENFKTVSYDNDEIIAIENEGDAVDEIWQKYSR